MLSFELLKFTPILKAWMLMNMLYVVISLMRVNDFLF
jgi:hypothetical protein